VYRQSLIQSCGDVTEQTGQRQSTGSQRPELVSRLWWSCRPPGKHDVSPQHTRSNSSSSISRCWSDACHLTSVV